MALYFSDVDEFEGVFFSSKKTSIRENDYEDLWSFLHKGYSFSIASSAAKDFGWKRHIFNDYHLLSL